MSALITHAQYTELCMYVYKCRCVCVSVLYVSVCKYKVKLAQRFKLNNTKITGG